MSIATAKPHAPDQMHHYPHHVGDYIKDTPHLSLLEHGAYRRLLDFSYSSERPLPLDFTMLYRVCGAVRLSEQNAVKIVVETFFTKTADGWTHKRVEKEIAKYRAKSEAGAAGAKAKWQPDTDDGKPDGKPDGKTMAPEMPTISARETKNQEPRTKNHTLAADKPPRARDEAFEALVIVQGANLAELTRPMRSQIKAALKIIRDVNPDVTAEEIQRRASAYSQQWPDVTRTAMALAKHWATMGQKKEGAAPAKTIKPADFPWRLVAHEHEGWEPAGDWADQTARSRSSLRDTWAGLPDDVKAALLARETAEKKEGAAAPGGEA